MTTDPKYIVLLGPPGSGKGTQAARLRQELDLPHVASGDLFRENLKNDTELGLKAKTYMDRGALVPDDVTIAMVMDRLARPDCARGAILDGFPRTQAQAEALDALLRRLAAPLDCCLALTVDTEEVVQRLVRRAEIEGRADDNEQTIRERMKVYDSQTAPLLAYYRDAGLLVEVDGMGEMDEVTARILEALDRS